MPTKEELKTGLMEVTKKLDDPKTKKSFEKFNKTMQFHFTDVGLDYYVTFEGGAVVAFEEGKFENPAVDVIMDGDTFLGILKKELNPINAYSSGKIKVKGEMTDLLKLQKLLG